MRTQGHGDEQRQRRSEPRPAMWAWAVVAAVGWLLVPIANLVSLVVAVAVGVLIAVRRGGPGQHFWLGVVQWTGVAVAFSVLASLTVVMAGARLQGPTPLAAPIPRHATTLDVVSEPFSSTRTTSTRFAVADRGTQAVVDFYADTFPTTAGWRMLDAGQPPGTPAWCWVAVPASDRAVVLSESEPGTYWVTTMLHVVPDASGGLGRRTEHDCRLLRDMAQASLL